MNYKKPKVSVIIPTYNRAYSIRRAIQSILDQTYKNFEIIIVDDGSTDDTEKIVKRFNDERIRYFRHDQNKGGGAARNTGIKAASGEYIAFQDSDDEWLPEKLEKQMKIFEDTRIEFSIVYTGSWRIENNKKVYIPYSWVTRKEGDIHKELLKGNFVTTQSIVLKKQCFEKSGMFDENFPRYQDWDLVIRLSKYYKFKFIDEPLLILYYTTDSISANHDISTHREAYIESLERILTKHYEDFKKEKNLLLIYYSDIGNLLCSNNNMKKGKIYFIKSYKLNPFNLKLLVTIMVSLFGPKIYKICFKELSRIRTSMNYMRK